MKKLFSLCMFITIAFASNAQTTYSHTYPIGAPNYRIWVKNTLQVDGTFILNAQATATLNFPSTATATSSDLTLRFAGAAVGDAVLLIPGLAAINANTSYSAWVSVGDTVKIRFNNYSGGTVDPASASFKVKLIK